MRYTLRGKHSQRMPTTRWHTGAQIIYKKFEILIRIMLHDVKGNVLINIWVKYLNFTSQHFKGGSWKYNIVWIIENRFLTWQKLVIAESSWCNFLGTLESVSSLLLTGEELGFKLGESESPNLALILLAATHLPSHLYGTQPPTCS